LEADARQKPVADGVSAADEWRQGWPSVAGSMAAMCAGINMFKNVNGLFVKPLAAEFGWHRGQLGMSAAAAVASTLCLPLAGALQF
jgi:hypothetical protein